MLHSGNLILVNNAQPLYLEHSGESELTLFCGKEPGILLEKEAASSLNDLLQAIKGRENILGVSGYRTQNEQRAIYSDSLKSNGPEFTRKYVALPNHSEHQTAGSGQKISKQSLAGIMQNELAQKADYYRKIFGKAGHE